jgi:hypothetical protein
MTKTTMAGSVGGMATTTNGHWMRKGGGEDMMAEQNTTIK